MQIPRRVPHNLRIRADHVQLLPAALAVNVAKETHFSYFQETKNYFLSRLETASMDG